MNSTDSFMTKRTIKTAGELRKFGVIMAIPLAIIGILMLWRGRFPGPYVISLAALFLVSGLVFPNLLRPVERFWMAFARVLSIIMTHVLLTLTFFLIITPFGWLLRMMGKDILQKRFDRTTSSYWVPVEPDGPSNRPDKPY
jgi:hypothetical protein